MIPWRLQDYIYPSYETADVSKVTADPPVRFVVGRFFLPRMAHRSGMFLFYASHGPLRTSADVRGGVVIGEWEGTFQGRVKMCS